MVQAQQYVQAQYQQQQQQPPALAAPGGYPSAPSSHDISPYNAIMYPGLADFMGLELSEEVIAANMPEYLRQNQLATVTSTTPAQNLTGMVAPLSGQSVGLRRAQTTNGIRELILCKGTDNKIGLRVKPINNGVFVTIVVKNTPAAMAGLRFGDQILQINGTIVAGFDMDAIHKLLRKSPKNDISIVVRDRPFERTITLHKNSLGHIGFQFKDGRITTIVKDSSAARNGLLIDHQILEVNGQNVVSMKDKELSAIINNENEQIITLTIIPSFIYDHMMKKLSNSFLRGIMDHSVPSDF